MISQFGGVTPGGTDNESGFAELRKVFYLAIDVFCSREHIVLANGAENKCEAFAGELVDDSLRLFDGNFFPQSSSLYPKIASLFFREQRYCQSL